MMSTNEINVTGTLIWYFCVCKREVWLLSHGIEADQEHEFLELGRIISESTYKRDKKEIEVGNIKADLIRKEEGQIIVGEVKKSSKYKEAATMQLLYYLNTLRQRGIDAKGRLFFPEERKTVDVELTDKSIKKLENMEVEILKISYQEHPPKAVKKTFCSTCAYSEFCFA
jgi:CRISPR-associated exonuclease Cas4